MALMVVETGPRTGQLHRVPDHGAVVQTPDAGHAAGRAEPGREGSQRPSLVRPGDVHGEDAQKVGRSGDSQAGGAPGRAGDKTVDAGE